MADLLKFVELDWKQLIDTNEKALLCEEIALQLVTKSPIWGIRNKQLKFMQKLKNAAENEGSFLDWHNATMALIGSLKRFQKVPRIQEDGTILDENFGTKVPLLIAYMLKNKPESEVDFKNCVTTLEFILMSCAANNEYFDR